MLGKNRHIPQSVSLIVSARRAWRRAIRARLEKLEASAPAELSGRADREQSQAWTSLLPDTIKVGRLQSVCFLQRSSIINLGRGRPYIRYRRRFFDRPGAPSRFESVRI